MMAPALIILGGEYVGKNGSVRKIIGVGPQFVLYKSQSDNDCVRWRLVERDAARKSPSLGTEGNCTRLSFAAWAKGRQA